MLAVLPVVPFLVSPRTPPTPRASQEALSGGQGLLTASVKELVLQLVRGWSGVCPGLLTGSVKGPGLTYRSNPKHGTFFGMFFLRFRNRPCMTQSRPLDWTSQGLLTGFRSRVFGPEVCTPRTAQKGSPKTSQRTQNTPPKHKCPPDLGHRDFAFKGAPSRPPPLRH